MPVQKLVGAAVVTLGVGLFVSGCLSLRARDLQDIGLNKIECSARDGSAQCACWSKCVSKATDCRCADD